MANYGIMESCCGIGEVFSLNLDPLDTLMDVYADLEDNISGDFEDEKPRKMVVFTDNNVRKFGLKLAAFIKKNELGPVTFSGWVQNTNRGHGTKVGLWTWKPYWTKVNKLVRAERKREEEEAAKRRAEYAAKHGKPIASWW